MLQTTFWEPIGDALMSQVRALGVEMVRVDVMRLTDDPGTAAVCVDEARRAALRPFVIVKDAAQLDALAAIYGTTAASEFWIEDPLPVFRNEMEAWRWTSRRILATRV